MADDAGDPARTSAYERSMGHMGLAQHLTLRYSCFTFNESFNKLTGGPKVRRMQRPPGLDVPLLSVPVLARDGHRTAFPGVACLAMMLALACGGVANAQATPVVIDRDGGTIVLEPYAPNIIRVTLSLNRNSALAAPGFGFVATPAADGWTHQQSDQGEVYRSSRLIVTVAANHPGKPMATQVDIGKFFNGSAPPANISIQTPEGKTLLQMNGWSMSVPNYKDGNAGVLNDKRPSDPPFYQVGASFVSPGRRALLWPRPVSRRLPGSSRTPRRMLAQLHRDRRSHRLRAFHGDQLRLWNHLGQSLPDGD